MNSQSIEKALRKARARAAKANRSPKDGKRHDRVGEWERKGMRSLFAYFSAQGLDLKDAIDNVAKEFTRDPQTVKSHLEGHEGEDRVGAALDDYTKLDDILSRVWVPEPQEVPIRSIMHRDGVNVEVVPDKGILRWEQEGNRVTRCWLERSEESWLLTVFLPRLGEKRREEFDTVWGSLQQRMCCYLNDATEYIFAIESGSGELTITEVVGALLGGSVANPKDPAVQRVWSLLDEAPRLSHDIDKFKERLWREARAYLQGVETS